MDVALFVPCYVDQLFPNVALATAALLERYGAKVHFPEAQVCCGQPVANSGFFADAAPAADLTLRAFEGFDHVVCPSGSCTAMVRHNYSRLLPGDPRVRSLAGRVHELCEFLHDVLKVEPRGTFAHRVAIQDSCHGLRELRLGSGTERSVKPFSKVRTLLQGLTGLTVVEGPRPDECCGFGGTFAVAEEAVSCAMGRSRLDAHAGAEIVTATDVSCLMHLDGLIRREKRPLRVMHVAEILAEATA